jgi:hypothetical protein
MEDIIGKIIREIESDPTINAKEVCLDMESKGFLKRRKALNVHGTVAFLAEKDRVMTIVNREAGDNYDVEDRLSVKGVS